MRQPIVAIRRHNVLHSHTDYDPARYAVSIKFMTWAFEQKIPGNIKIVLLALADNANDDGYCWPRQEVIAEKASVSVRNLRRLLNELAERGLIRVEERRRADGYKASNGYTLSPDNLAGEASVQEISPATTGHSQRPTVSDQEPSEEPPKSVNAAMATDRDWEVFWDRWPKKVGKIEARKAWLAVTKHTPATVILAGLDRLLPSYMASEARFRPDPTRWLKGQRWNDEIADSGKPTGTAKNGGPRVPVQNEWEYR